jgi:hypothetical protein
MTNSLPFTICNKVFIWCQVIQQKTTGFLHTNQVTQIPLNNTPVAQNTTIDQSQDLPAFSTEEKRPEREKATKPIEEDAHKEAGKENSRFNF